MSVEVIVRMITRSGQTVEMPLDEWHEIQAEARKVPVLTAVDVRTVSSPTLSMQETVPPDTETPKTVAQLAEEQKQVNAIPSVMPKPFAGKALPIQTPPATAETKPENPTEAPPAG